jgi:hypothetical protein
MGMEKLTWINQNRNVGKSSSFEKKLKKNQQWCDEMIEDVK